MVVCDDQPEFCNSTNIPDADEYHIEDWNTIGESVQLTPWTNVVFTTRDLEVDVAVLPKIIESDVAYIGVIGSRRRWAKTTSKLRDLGDSDKQLEGIYSPIGLDLKAETPKEIALSIFAEMISIKNHTDRKSLSGK